ncbi:MAG: gas vesicle protein K, partial [Elainellaceae cyanobacterium]
MPPIDASPSSNLSISPATDTSPFQQNTSQNSEAGLAPLLLTVVELIRQLMEAQVIRRMDNDQLTEG